MAVWKWTCWTNWQINWLAEALWVALLPRQLPRESHFHPRVRFRGNLLRNHCLRNNRLASLRQDQQRIRPIRRNPPFPRRFPDSLTLGAVFRLRWPKAWPNKKRQALMRRRINQPPAAKITSKP